MIMDTPYYVNREDEPVWCITAMTKGGAWVLAKRYRDKMGSTILEEPMEREDSIWVVMVSNPFMERD
jgi:hypothetical protein